MFNLLTDWQGQAATGWFLSEKKDGWRLGWTGAEFVTRGGHVLPVPAAWKAGMPGFALDGELFAGRGEFNSIQRRMRDGFAGLAFHVFDMPGPGAFRQRLRALRGLALPDHCQLVEHTRCKGLEHLLEAADTIVEQGGEGVVLRNPKALYLPGRSRDVLRWVPVPPERNRRVA